MTEEMTVESIRADQALSEQLVKEAKAAKTMAWYLKQSDTIFDLHGRLLAAVPFLLAELQAAQDAYEHEHDDCLRIGRERQDALDEARWTAGALRPFALLARAIPEADEDKHNRDNLPYIKMNDAVITYGDIEFADTMYRYAEKHEKARLRGDETPINDEGYHFLIGEFMNLVDSCEGKGVDFNDQDGFTLQDCRDNINWHLERLGFDSEIIPLLWTGESQLTSS